MPKSGTFVGLFFIAVVGACSFFFLAFPFKPAAIPVAQTEEETDGAANSRAYEKRRLETRVLARLFPTATEVRLFAWDFTGVSGKPEQIAPEGVKLTNAEIASLRKVVWFAEEPRAVASCCIPRHSFKFYDKSRKTIGELRVCFECYCASIDGEAPPKETHTWVDWDMAKMKKIVLNHGIATDFR